MSLIIDTAVLKSFFVILHTLFLDTCHLCNNSKNILLLPRNAREISLVFYYVPMSICLLCFQEKDENSRPQTAKNITYLENLFLSNKQEITERNCSWQISANIFYSHTGTTQLSRMANIVLPLLALQRRLEGMGQEQKLCWDLLSFLTKEHQKFPTKVQK